MRGRCVWTPVSSSFVLLQVAQQTSLTPLCAISRYFVRVIFRKWEWWAFDASDSPYVSIHSIWKCPFFLHCCQDWIWIFEIFTNIKLSIKGWKGIMCFYFAFCCFLVKVNFFFLIIYCYICTVFLPLWIVHSYPFTWCFYLVLNNF